MPRKTGSHCNRDGCSGTMAAHRLDWAPDPRPIRTLKCNTCGQVLFVVHEAGKKVIELWLIDQGQDESFREYVDRTYDGKGGPMDYLV